MFNTPKNLTKPDYGTLTCSLYGRVSSSAHILGNPFDTRYRESLKRLIDSIDIYFIRTCQNVQYSENKFLFIRYFHELKKTLPEEEILNLLARKYFTELQKTENKFDSKKIDSTLYFKNQTSKFYSFLKNLISTKIDITLEKLVVDDIFASKNLEEILAKYPILDWTKQNNIVQKIILDILIQKKLLTLSSSDNLSAFLLSLINIKSSEKIDDSSISSIPQDASNPEGICESPFLQFDEISSKNFKSSIKLKSQISENIDDIYKKLNQIIVYLRELLKDKSNIKIDEIEQYCKTIDCYRDFFEQSTKNFSSISMQSLDESLKSPANSRSFDEIAMKYSANMKAFIPNLFDPKRVHDAKKIYGGKYYRSKVAFTEVKKLLSKICKENNFIDGNFKNFNASDRFSFFLSG